MDARIFKGSFSLGTATQTANTVITSFIPPHSNRFRTRITSVDYRCGSTINVLSFLRPLGETTVAAAVAEAGTTITLTANPGVTGNAAASNDWFAVKLVDGRYQYGTFTLSSLTATVTAVAADTGGIAAGAKFWWFGLPADTGNLQITPAASTTRTYFDPVSGIFTTGLPSSLYDEDIYDNRSGFGDPVIVHCPNATAQCWIDRISGYYAAS
jgi:hypothetical protein